MFVCFRMKWTESDFSRFPDPMSRHPRCCHSGVHFSTHAQLIAIKPKLDGSKNLKVKRGRRTRGTRRRKRRRIRGGRIRGGRIRGGRIRGGRIRGGEKEEKKTVTRLHLLSEAGESCRTEKRTKRTKRTKRCELEPFTWPLLCDDHNAKQHAKVTRTRL